MIEDTDSAIIICADRADNSRLLELKHSGGGRQRVYLYRVTIYNPIESIYLSPVCVLAEDSKGAVRQSTSGKMDGRMYGDEEFEKTVIDKSIVTRETLYIRGWGNSEF